MSFKQWAYNETRNEYTGVLEIRKQLPSGLYTTRLNNWGDPVAHQHDLRKDSMCEFKCGPLKSVIQEINNFWNSAEYYKSLGVSHKRGILLYGPPGCGKTGIISVIIEDTIQRNGLVFRVDDACDFSASIKLTRQIENNRPVVAVMEDIEKYIEDGDEETLLEIMDGASSLGDGMLFVATTNHLKKLPPRLRCRPSRIDTLIEIDFPTLEHRYEYLKYLLAKKEGTNVKEWAEKTPGFSLAQLKELVISVYIYRKPLEESIKRLRELNIVPEQDD